MHRYDVVRLAKADDTSMTEERERENIYGVAIVVFPAETPSL